MIELDHVTVRFQDRIILDDISISLTEHRIGVIGDNGSGKSTFARLLNGLLLPDQGDVTVNDFDTRADGKMVRSQVGFLFQNPDNQIVMPTVAEDLALGLKPLNLSKDEQAHRVTDVLERFALAHLVDRSAHLLSGGEKQLVALAGVMVTEPDILICDEPTTLLDRRNATHVMRLIADLPCQVIVVTHHVEHLN
ncbi:MAG: ABC transporter ATP-binding protein, partial [Rhodospirillaceae bacterium]|nr:ABC transporter ATP-binding protein [Rhodospirillaceae bacterium]